MSFLQVFNDLNGQSSQTPSVASNASRPQIRTPVSPGATPGSNPAITGLKRKAGPGDNGSAPKSPRTVNQTLPGRPAVAERKGPTPVPRNNDKGALSRPSTGSESPVTKSGSSTTTSAAAGGTGKKGSYREILARAQAAKAAQTDFGQIKHRTGQKLSRRARRMAQEQEVSQGSKKQAVPSGQQRAGQAVRPNQPNAHSERVKPKRAPLEYKGTMRPGATPAQPQRPQGGVASTARDKQKARMSNRYAASDDEVASSKYRYAGSSDEELEDEESVVEDDEEDMNGGGFDELEQEEELSLRAARKEDAEALRQENEHRRLKLERKKKLEQLAAKAKPRY